MKKINTILSIKVLLLITVFVMSAVSVFAFGPTGPAPTNNVEGPLNVGPAFQEKTGALQVDGDISGGSNLYLVGGENAHGNISTDSSFNAAPLAGVGPRPLCATSNGTITVTGCITSTGLPVGLTSANLNETLRWNGTAWINTSVLKTTTTGINVTGGITTTGNVLFGASTTPYTNNTVGVYGSSVLTGNESVGHTLFADQAQLGGSGTGHNLTVYGDVIVPPLNPSGVVKPLCIGTTGTLTIGCPPIVIPALPAQGIIGGLLPTALNTQTIRFNTAASGGPKWEASSTLTNNGSSIFVGSSGTNANLFVYGNQVNSGVITNTSYALTGAPIRHLCVDLNGQFTMSCPNNGSVGGSLPAVGSVNNVLKNIAGVWTSSPIAQGTVGGSLPTGAIGQVLHSNGAAWLGTGGSLTEDANGAAVTGTFIVLNNATTTLTGNLTTSRSVSLGIPGYHVTIPDLSWTGNAYPSGRVVCTSPGGILTSNLFGGACPRGILDGLLPSPGASGTVLTSNGSAWQPAPLPVQLPLSGNTSGDVLTWNGATNAWVPFASGSTDGQTLRWNPNKFATNQGGWEPTMWLSDNAGFTLSTSNIFMAAGDTQLGLNPSNITYIAGNTTVGGTLGNPLGNPNASLTVNGNTTIGTNGHNNSLLVNGGTLTNTLYSWGETHLAFNSGNVLVGDVTNPGSYNASLFVRSLEGQPQPNWITGPITTVCVVGSGSNAGLVIQCPPPVHSTTPVTFSTNGTWTVPAGVTSINLESWGGGGGGGGGGGEAGFWRPASYTPWGAVGSTGGAGGGAGGYTKVTIPVTPGQTFNINIGQGGVGGMGGPSQELISPARADSWYMGSNGVNGTNTTVTTTPLVYPTTPITIIAGGGQGGNAGYFPFVTTGSAWSTSFNNRNNFPTTGGAGGTGYNFGQNGNDGGATGVGIGGSTIFGSANSYGAIADWSRFTDVNGNYLSGNPGLFQSNSTGPVAIGTPVVVFNISYINNPLASAHGEDASFYGVGGAGGGPDYSRGHGYNRTVNQNNMSFVGGAAGGSGADGYVKITY